MSSTGEKPLLVYKASAGSGKTFRLAVNYIKALMGDYKKYKEILAVTFTNKATGEMKQRILQQLYGLAHGLDDSNDYMREIRRGTNLSENDVRKCARKALEDIVNDYDHFHITTIDSFFQAVLQNLAHEMGLNANLNVSLNDYEVERQAVIEMVEQASKNNDIVRWLMEDIHEKIQENENWNILKDITKFGKNIFKDVYKTHRSQIDNVLKTPNKMNEYKKKLYSLKNDKKKELEKYYSEWLNKAQDSLAYGLQEDWFSKRSPYKFFINLKNGAAPEKLFTESIVKNMDTPNGWLHKKYDTPDNQNIVSTRLVPVIQDAYKKLNEILCTIITVDSATKHLYQLRLLNHISEKVKELNMESNSFLLSDTQNLLHKLIADTDAPFIFEKIGGRLSTIMIDEFQDTSRLQWLNFKPLLKECMAKGNSNLIVGDVKQSIYRWRDGDWKLLNNIKNEFKESWISEESLQMNYRSDFNIVNFNNKFFTEAVNHELQLIDDEKRREQIRSAYKDVVQQAGKGNEPKGLVKIQFMPKEDYEKNCYEMIYEQIKELKDCGVSYKDIAILVRSNSTIQDIAAYFMQQHPEITLVSNEALRMDSSLSVNIIISAMRILCHTDNGLEKATLAKYYQHFILAKDVESIDLSAEHVEELLPSSFINERERLLSMPIIELVHELMEIFQLSKISNEGAYICGFYDLLSDYLKNNIGSIDSFLKAWDESLCAKSIQTGEADGVRLITIHGSKGLEFDNVIMPACDWKLEKPNTIWCSPKTPPYNEMPLLPIDYKKDLGNTIFKEDYEEERMQTVVDNLNMLYVALTRPKRNLFIYGKSSTPGSRAQLFWDIMESIAEKLDGSQIDKSEDNKDKRLTFIYGALDTDSKSEKVSENVFMPKIENEPVDICNYTKALEFRQSDKSKEFTEGEDDQSKAYLKTGRLLHAVLANINSADDLPNAIKTMEQDGMLDSEDQSQQKLISFLEKRLQSPQVSDWFSGQWKVFNECNIICYDANEGKITERRPDRVMEKDGKLVVIDYKFAAPTTKHENQVREYMTLLAGMGYKKIEGYLWYVYPNKIKEIK